MHNILLCDDDPTCLQWSQAILEKKGINCLLFTDPKKTLIHLSKNPMPDMAILDVNMEPIDGYTLAHILQKLPGSESLPILFLTSKEGPENELEAFKNGGSDFVTKPVSPKILLTRVTRILENQKAKKLLEEHQEILKKEVVEKTQEIAALQKIIIFALTSLCSERDQETGSHILRTQFYVKILAQTIGYPHEEIERYAPLHDIGKIGIPDKILLKPGKLEPEEFEIIKTHTIIGHRAIAHATQQFHNDIGHLSTASNIIRHHHERWDGNGYPDKLSKENIPIEARIMAIADVYDALRSKRPYKEPFPHQKALAIIQAERGKQFEAILVDAFLENEKLFEEISETHQTQEKEIELMQRKLKIFA